MREQCLESVMLAAGGAFASYVMFELLRVVMDTEFSLAMPFGGRTALSFHPALNVPALTIAVSSLLIALVVFGLEPAIQLTRTLDVRGALAGGSAAGRSAAGASGFSCGGRSPSRPGSSSSPPCS